MRRGPGSGQATAPGPSAGPGSYADFLNVRLVIELGTSADEPGFGADAAQLYRRRVAHRERRGRAAARRGDRRRRSPGSPRPASTSAAALDYGRRVGGPALRELTFHQRAALLKALASHLREHRDELYALSARTGATLGDSKFDVDGGIGVLLTYASKGRRELPNDTVYVDGGVEPLGKGGTFARPAHLHARCAASRCRSTRSTSRSGGRWRSSRPAFLAGVPTLVKPASQTAYLTAKLVELIVESGPAARGHPAARLRQRGRPARPPHRAGPGRLHRLGVHRAAGCAPTRRDRPRSVRFNAEADSLNCSILGPDAAPGTPGVRPVRQAARHRDDGQGRAEVHRDPPRVRAGRAARRRGARPCAARLAKVSVGNPADPRVRMGALAGLEQREEVRRSRQGAGRRRRAIVFGDPEHVDVDRRRRRARRVHVADPAARRRPGPRRAARGRGVRAGQHARCRTPRPATSIELAARGQGSLVGSVVTDDADVRPRRRARRSRRGTAGCWCSTPRPRRSPPGTARRCRHWCTAAPAGPAAARRWAASAACCTTCSAPPCRPPRHAHRGHRPLGAGRGAHGRAACTRSASTCASCGSATPWSPARAR